MYLTQREKKLGVFHVFEIIVFKLSVLKDSTILQVWNNRGKGLTIKTKAQRSEAAEQFMVFLFW